MRTAYLIAAVAAILLAGCETTSEESSLPIISASGKSAADRGTVFLKVFVDEDARAKAPVDMQIKIDDKPVINRSFSLGKDSDDGQYQITLPSGKHTLTASSQRAVADITKQFIVRRQQDRFIELYVTDQGRLRLTRDSKIRILKFVIRTVRKSRQKNFNPNMWMRLSAQPPASDWDALQRERLVPSARANPDPATGNLQTKKATA